MNRTEDSDLREALRRREAKRQPATLPDDFLDRVMQGIEEQEKQSLDMQKQGIEPSAKRHSWRITLAALAAAASILLLLTLHYHSMVRPEGQNLEEQQAKQVPAQQVLAEQQSTAQPLPSLVGEGSGVGSVSVTDTQGTQVGVRDIVVPPPAPPQHRKASPEPPDTLGDGIWQQKEHVLLALQLLAECEADGAQRERNAIVEAVFQTAQVEGIGDASPQALQLVVSETGDYTIVDDRQPVIIEL